MTRFWTALAVICAAGFAAAQDVPLGQLPAGVTPQHYRIDLHILPEAEHFSGEVEIDITVAAPADHIWLHGRDLAVSRATLQVGAGEVIALHYEEMEGKGVALLRANREIPAGFAKLRIAYSAPFDRSLNGLYKTQRGGRASAFTQLQAIRARKVFPGFDEPRFKTPFDISVTVPQGETVISNAPAIDETAVPGGLKRVQFQTTAPLPTYLLAFAVGALDVVDWTPIPPNDVRDWPVPLRGIVPAGKGAQIRFALESTAPMLAAMEAYFGIPYPFAKLDLVAPVEFKSGGMENAGAIFYRQDNILMTDTPSVWQLRGFGYLHAHELAHSWFGNLVTPKWWDDLWLNEAFATWMGYKFAHQWRPDLTDARSIIRAGHQAMGSDRRPGSQPIHRQVANEGDIGRAFDSVTYSKGAAVLAMIEQFIGEDVFRDGVRRFVGTHANGTATADDFIAALSDAAQNPAIIASFHAFLDQPGIPRVTQALICHEDGQADLHLSQQRSFPLGAKGDTAMTWPIPLCVAYGMDGAAHRQCGIMDAPEQVVTLAVPGCPDWVHPNARGAAYLQFDMPPADWDMLIAHLNDLPPSETLAVLHSIAAAYEAGQVSTAQLLRAAEAAALSEHRDIVWALTQPIKNIDLFMVAEDQRADFKAIMRQIYQPALARFDTSAAAFARPETAPAKAMFRSNITWFMAQNAQDPALRAVLAPLGLRYTGFPDGPLDPAAVQPDLLRLALVVAAGENGMAFMRHLGALMQETDDDVLRGHLIYALAYQDAPDKVAAVWDLIMDPDTSRLDASHLLRRQAQIAANRDLVFDWFTANYDAVMARMPSSHRRWMAWRAYAQCDAPGRAKVAAFFGPRSGDFPGADDVLKDVLHHIDICIAVAARHAPEVAEVIRTWAD